MTSEEEKTLDQLLRAKGGLFGKELDFVEDLDGMRAMRLSEKQAAWLNRIADRVL